MMQAIEFVGHMEDGAVKIPKEYQAQLGDTFRIIILQDEPTEKQEPKTRDCSSHANLFQKAYWRGFLRMQDFEQFAFIIKTCYYFHDTWISQPERGVVFCE